MWRTAALLLIAVLTIAGDRTATAAATRFPRTSGDEPSSAGDLTRPRVIDPHSVGVGRCIPDARAATLSGERVSWRSGSDATLTVVAMTSVTCPLSAKFAPALARLESELLASGVRFVFVNATGVDTSDEMRAQVAALGFKGPMLDDRARAVASAFDARTTTEVFLVDARGTLLYRGAVNDQYGIGYSTDAPKQRWLEDAIKAALAARRPEVEATTAPGCALERSRASSLKGDGETPDSPASGVTYAREIARIVQDRCVECHRIGGVAPFALEDYDSVARRASMIRRVIDAGIMPPWFAAPHDGDSPWANDRSLSAGEKAAITTWIDAGVPRGDDADLPLPRRFADGEWSIGTPDLVLQLPQPIEIPAEGIMAYQEVLIPTGVDRDRWVRGVEIVPSNRAVVHHVLVFVIPQSASKDGALSRGVRVDETRSFFAAYVPGNGAVVYPRGYARRLPAHASLLVQIHYTPNGRATSDQMRVGLLLQEEAPDHIVRTEGIANLALRIPAGAEDHKERALQSVPFDARIIAFLPHMHVRGKAFRYELEAPDGTRTVLLDIPRYDFNWQWRYLLRNPIEVAANSTLHCTAWFDNSAANPANPDATKVVRWGKQSFDEMMIGYVEYVLAVEDPAHDEGQGPQHAAPLRRRAKSPPAGGERGPTLAQWLDQFDVNGDGRIDQRELPKQLQRYFARYDHDGDGVLTRDEIDRASDAAADR